MRYLIIILLFTSCATAKRMVNRSNESTSNFLVRDSDSLATAHAEIVTVSKDTASMVSRTDSTYDYTVEEEILDFIVSDREYDSLYNSEEEQVKGVLVRKTVRTIKASGKKEVDVITLAHRSDSSHSVSTAAARKQDSETSASTVKKAEVKKDVKRTYLPWWILALLIIIIYLKRHSLRRILMRVWTYIRSE